jgi:hypothetical protein
LQFACQQRFPISGHSICPHRNQYDPPRDVGLGESNNWEALLRTPQETEQELRGLGVRLDGGNVVHLAAWRH